MSIKYIDQLAEADIEPSVGSVGGSYDNAWARPLTVYKAEVIRARCFSRGCKMELASLEWVRWFSHCSVLEAISNIPPAETEANFYAALKSRL